MHRVAFVFPQIVQKDHFKHKGIVDILLNVAYKK